MAILYDNLYPIGITTYVKNDFNLSTDVPSFVNYVNIPGSSSLNNSKSFQKSVIKFFYKKITKKWLYTDLISLNGLVMKNKDGEITFIKAYTDYNASKIQDLSPSELEKRIKFLSKHLITKKSVKHVLKKFINNNFNIDVKWTTVYKYKDRLKKIFLKHYEHAVEKALTKI